MLGSIQGTQAVNSTVWNVTSDAIAGFSTFGNLLPVIIIMAFAFIVLWAIIMIKNSVASRL